MERFQPAWLAHLFMERFQPACLAQLRNGRWGCTHENQVVVAHGPNPRPHGFGLRAGLGLEAANRQIHASVHVIRRDLTLLCASDHLAVFQACFWRGEGHNLSVPRLFKMPFRQGVPTPRVDPRRTELPFMEAVAQSSSSSSLLVTSSASWRVLLSVARSVNILCLPPIVVMPVGCRV
jgi:hypothetical protein